MTRRLALWAARTAAADRLARGSAAVWQHRVAAVTAWVRAGRRADLTGWRAALGPAARLVILGAVAYALWAVVRALPWLMWLLAGWWLRAAWKAGKTPCAEADEPPAAEAPAEADDSALRTLLLDLMGEGSGVHLRTVLAHLQKHGQWEGRTVTDLRLRLERLEVPVHRGVKVAGVPTWGVRRRDLQAPSPTPAAEASTAASTAA